MATLIEQVEQWGVVGAGGAGFPTHVKLKAQAKTIILNGAECEPLLHKDKELMKAYGKEVIDGLEQARQQVGAEEAIVGIKGKYTDVIEAMQAILPPQHRIAALSDSYPAGDEFILVYDTTGKIIQPGGIPLHVGCVVINVETAMNIARAKPVTRKYLTVAGAVHHPVTIGIPIGATFAEAIELAGGATVSDPVVLVGGAMMGKYSEDLTTPITKTTGGLIVLGRDHPLVARYTKTWKQVETIGASGCDQCYFCTFYCPRYLLGHPIEPHLAMRSLQFNMAGEVNVIGTEFCCECNLCTMMSCPEDLYPAQVCGENKHRILASGNRWKTEAEEHRPELHLDNRRVPIARLILKLGLSQFTNKGPLHDNGFMPKRIVLPLKQHAGPPAEPIVKVGDRVSEGDVIARPAPGKLGAPIHASITGKVTAVSDKVIIES
ncbi:MAG: hypothetical protein GC162_06450 [Planctomycetes bacterium]|nr:hypothetical protein [Planctomycetota bacterium]